jgi:hypothetical protein
MDRIAYEPLQTHAAPLQARGGMAAFELVEAGRIDAQGSSEGAGCF